MRPTLTDIRRYLRVADAIHHPRNNGQNGDDCLTAHLERIYPTRRTQDN